MRYKAWAAKDAYGLSRSRSSVRSRPPELCTAVRQRLRVGEITRAIAAHIAARRVGAAAIGGAAAGSYYGAYGYSRITAASGPSFSFVWIEVTPRPELVGSARHFWPRRKPRRTERQKDRKIAGELPTR